MACDTRSGFSVSSGGRRMQRACLALACIGATVTAVSCEVAGGTNQRDEPRTILMSYDMASMWFPARVAAEKEGADAETIKGLLEHVVDEHAEAQVDILTHCVFARFQTHMQDTQTVEPRRDNLYKNRGPKTLHDAGYDLIQIILDRCRSRDIRFLAGLRMNDRHGAARNARFYKEHPQWHLKGFAGGLDYKHEGVRNKVLAFIDELMDKYDVDGIELDYMRWAHVFVPSEAVGNAPLLTDFTRRARESLDAAGRKRGRGRLLLGVRVPQTMKECRDLGFDVAAWVREGYVDYVSPSDFFYTDFNARTEDFVALTDGTDCKVYPTIHPIVTQTNDVELLAAANYRAAANNFYAFGAHGVSAYNYQYNWAQMISNYKFGPKEMWPKALRFMTQLRKEASIERDDRHYLYHPLWNGNAPTGAPKNERIVLARGDAGARGVFPFRMAEALPDGSVRADLEFKVTGMAEGDALTIDVNGTAIPADRIEWTYDEDGQPASEGRKIAPFHLYRFRLGAPPAVFGDNELGVRIATSAGTEKLDIQEIEVRVQVLERGGG